MGGRGMPPYPPTPGWAPQQQQTGQQAQRGAHGPFRKPPVPQNMQGPAGAFKAYSARSKAKYCTLFSLVCTYL